ncbi:hypothetical protein NLI96_g4455 [Meripilus lineatus]|uniref:Uncharacterized protein n=1 Tax=Meripilus lineatus TaxID=2056292 RepID=A0AAD5V548_9APHY|nr:hypothetical protein NLI96_g4455 [Physisporinus lineatus]
MAPGNGGQNLGEQRAPTKAQNKTSRKSDTGKTTQERPETMNSVLKARKHMVKQGWMPGDEDFTILDIAQALTQIAEAASAPTRDSIRAAAILITDKLQEEEQNGSGVKEIAERIAELVGNRLEREIGRPLTEVAEGVRESSEQMRAVSTSFENIIKKRKEEETYQGRERGETAQDGTPTYAHMTAKSPQGEKLNGGIAREAYKQKRITLEWPNNGDKSTRALTELELVSKGNLALERMKEEERYEIPEGISFLCARKQGDRGFQLELNTVENANWIRQGDNTKDFTKYFDGGLCTPKVQTFAMLAEFVPVSFEPENQQAVEEMARANGIDVQEIKSTRWIKPIGRRNPGQYTAHLLIHLTSPDTANRVQNEGLIIEAKHVYIRRPQRDPHRCLKCHHYGTGHIAKTCPQKDDTCGTCGKGHRSSECTVNDQEHFWCANCKTKGHASWDRACPIFLEQKRLMHEKHPETNLIYYPTDDPRTWVMNPNPPYARPRQTEDNLRQTRKEGDAMQAPDDGYTTILRRRRQGSKGTSDNQAPPAARPAKTAHTPINPTTGNSDRLKTKSDSEHAAQFSGR